jgi:hypothetical protein
MPPPSSGLTLKRETACPYLYIYQNFGMTCCLHFQDNMKMEENIPSKN